MKTRNKKSTLDLPEEFVVSTNLFVNHGDNAQKDNYRSGRSNNYFGGSRKARQNFKNLASAVKNAPVVEGVRVPDDETDIIVHRGGRYINNMYVPGEVTITAEMSPSHEVSFRDEHVRSARSYQSAGDVYYNTNEYTFSPLQHYEQQQQQQYQQQPEQGGAVFPAEEDDFVIEMQTYQQCPDCPTFSVPVPVPKFPQTFPTEKTEPKSLIARLADVVRPVVKRAKNFLTGTDEISSRIDTVDSGVNHGGNKMTAPIMASLAAVGVGLAAYFGQNLAGSGRKFEDNTEYVEILNNIDNELEYLSHSSVDDALCLPRRYCDNLKSQKQFLDNYPNMKTVAAFLTEAYFENIGGDNYSHSQCNIRDCLQELLH